jgi:alpha-aminoadipic semialdehyde synthase
MNNRIGIRLEDKNEWERRAPLTPGDVKELVAQGVEIEVQRFERRAFPDHEYERAGAKLVDDVLPCEIVMGIKEMPAAYFRPDGAYMFFSHTIKGQSFNMKMLASLVERRCTLFDFELVTDDQGKRLIFAGRFAGLAGMIDTLWTLGQRLKVMGHDTPFADIEQAYRYEDLEAAKAAVAAVGERIATEGVPAELAPMTFGFAGYGHVSMGAQEIFDLLPHVEVAPGDLNSFVEGNGSLRDKLVKSIYYEKDLVQRTDDSKSFELQEYYDHPERYHSSFEPHLELLSVLVNGIYWEPRYPKLADGQQLRKLFSGDQPPRLIAVGDITCDVDGSLACTVRDTETGDPVYIYDPLTGKAPSGFEGPGLAVMAVGNLPCELPRETCVPFSQALKPFIPALASVDLDAEFDEAGLPGPFRRSTILWRGEFTPNFRYMRDFLNGSNAGTDEEGKKQ